MPKPTKISHLYRFDFDKGIPVTHYAGGEVSYYKWRKGIKTISAYGLQDAVEKFAMPVLKKFGSACKLNVVKAFVSADGKNWREIDLQTIQFTAFLVGCVERMKREGQPA